MGPCTQGEDLDRSSDGSTPTVEDQSGAAAAELSDSSIGSDGSDVFHVIVEPEKWWTTVEDMELQKISAASVLLRSKPLLPPNPTGATQDWLDVASGILLPCAHCAFNGCPWVGTHTDQIGNHVATCRADLLNSVLHVVGRNLRVDEYMAYCTAAIAEKERNGIPQ